MSADRLVSIVRVEAGLEAVISREEENGEKLSFALEVRPLAAVTHVEVPRREQLEEAWSALGAVRTTDIPVLSRIAMVLFETVARPGLATMPPSLAVWPASEALYGGRVAARSPRRRRPLDLRPLLCDSRARGRLEAALRRHADAIARQLEPRGYDGERVRAALQLPDPYVGYHYQAALGRGLPSSFRIWLGDRRSHPIPRKLRLHLDGGALLTEASIERHRQTLARRVVLVRLELLRGMVLRESAGGLAPTLTGDEGGRHAVLLLGSIHRNRRLLRRLLGAYARGQRDFGRDHVASRAWLARHPRLDLDLWTRGIPYQREVEGYGRVRICLEQDPLEALKLGTHVGSCLSLGGACAYSAVAVVADVNKQVLYARREDGTFVGRQVVAITEDDRLVFFPIYPRSAAEAIQAVFLGFDRAFAKALGLELFRTDTEYDYKVVTILAEDWWDDGAWERLAVSERAAADTQPELAGARE